ncbi:hypothetical protein QBC47DRAFT_59056 [Echria macrotheca]|uniref:Uncharacterized protein n=1 Tax=Echria macrotheca TaxID=438768 RepID=A0AAJ0B6B1_9PEZI|nr:hypothetical protein QBC47DRAFT_59056 [Echria macrotheca]
MPSVAQEMPTVLSCKKRARDDFDITTPQISLYAESLAKSPILLPDHLVDRPTSEPPSTHLAITPLSVPFDQQRSSPLKRKIIPFRSIKRQRIHVDEEKENGEDREMRLGSSPSRDQPDGSKHDDNTLDSQQLQQPAVRVTTTSSAANLMARCHICSRKPAKISDLELFTDCEGCGQRACDICMRECLGWRPGRRPPSPVARPRSQVPRRGESDGWRKGGHREWICSRCCVERGPDGDIVCLGCLDFMSRAEG